METIRNILEPIISPERIELMMFFFKTLRVLVLVILGVLLGGAIIEQTPNAINDRERPHFTQTIFFIILEILTALNCVLILALFVLH